MPHVVVHPAPGIMPEPEPEKPAPHWYVPPQDQNEYESDPPIIEWSIIIPPDPCIQ